jgi:hypothetical protein
MRNSGLQLVAKNLIIFDNSIYKKLYFILKKKHKPYKENVNSIFYVKKKNPSGTCKIKRFNTKI